MNHSIHNGLSIVKKIKTVTIALLSTLAIVATGCGSADQNADVTMNAKKLFSIMPLGTGGLARMTLSSNRCGLAELKSVFVRVLKVQIATATGEWLTMVDYGEPGRVFDLLDLTNGNTAELGFFNVNPGTYSQVRLLIGKESTGYVENNGILESVPVKVPSGAQTGIKIVRDFTVTSRGFTVINLEFNAAKSIVYNDGQGYILKPTIKCTGATTTEAVVNTVTAAEGGSAGIINEIVAEIPAGAIEEDTNVTITTIDRPAQMPESSAVFMSNIYELGPDGIQFSTPITLTLNYSDEMLTALAIDESSLAITYFDSAQNTWVDLGGTVDAANNTVTTQVSHFTPFSITGFSKKLPRIKSFTMTMASDGTNVSEVPTSISASITDPDGTVQDAQLYIRKMGESSYRVVTMTNTSGDLFVAAIPEDFSTYDTAPVSFEYFISATDNMGLVSYAPSTAPQAINIASYNPDLDSDGMNDAWELKYGLDIYSNDTAMDPDNDWFTNIQEFTNRTNPIVATPNPVLHIYAYAYSTNFNCFRVMRMNVTSLPPATTTYSIRYNVHWLRTYSYRSCWWFTCSTRHEDRPNYSNGYLQGINPNTRSFTLYDDSIHYNDFPIPNRTPTSTTKYYSISTEITAIKDAYSSYMEWLYWSLP